MHRARTLFAGLSLLASVAAACNGSGDAAQRDADDLAPAVTEGLSREEIQNRAQPMSPEQAEALGIIDTITHLERPAPPDTLLPPVRDDTTARADTLP